MRMWSVGATATFTIPDGTKIDPSGQSDTPSTILVVTEKGRNNLLGADASGQVINLAKDNEVELIPGRCRDRQIHVAQ